MSPVRRSNSLRLTAGVLLIPLVGALASCGGDSASSDSGNSILVGTTTPLTGAAGSTCKPMADGATAWFKKVNADGGVDGRDIRAEVLDDAYSAPEAASNVRALLDEEMAVLFNGCGSLQPPAVLPILDQADVPYLFPYASVPGLDEQKSAYLTLPLYADSMGVFAKDAQDRYGAGRVFVITQGIPGADETIDAVKGATEDAGGTFVGSEKTEAGQSDWTPLVLKIKSLDPDYVMIVVNSADAARIVTTMKAQDAYPSKWILASNSTPTQAFLSGVGDAADGKVLAVSVPAPPADPAAKSCLDAFKEYAPDLVPDGLSLTGCANAQALITALEEAAPDITPESVAKVVEGWQDKAASPVMGKLSFSAEDHQGITELYVVGVEAQRLTSEYKLTID